MISNNFFVYAMKILGEIGRDLIFFPVWWYSGGLMIAYNSLFGFLKNREKGLGLMIWIKNVFKPMYGQEDWQGKIISFGMRLIQIFFRSIIMLFWIILVLLIFLFWLLLPFIVLFEIIFQLFTLS